MTNRTTNHVHLHLSSQPRLSLRFAFLFLLHAQYSAFAKQPILAFNLHSQIHKFRRRIMTNKNTKIRVQSAPDDCLENITTIEDIRSKIANVRALQGSFRDATLYQRKWNPTNEKDSDVNDSDSTCTLKLLQFNTLAQGLSAGPSLQIPTPFDAKCCRKDIYGGFSNIPNPEIVLDFDLRRWRLMEVLLEDDYDIIAMEEVDRFHGFFEPLLNILGYQGLFTPKPFSPGVSMGWYSDGCALFWKKDTLELLKEEKGAYEMGSGSQVYTIATMRHVATDRVLVVAMTHLKAGKTIENEIVRVGQVEELLGAVQASAQNAAKLGNIALDEIPVVVAGDFNSDPKENNSCIRGIQSKDSIYPMKSAYEVDSITHSSMFTTWKTRGDMTVKRIIDYIFHNAGVTKGFDCSHTLQNPVDYEVEETRLPGFKYPSDHIAVGAKFKLER